MEDVKMRLIGKKIVANFKNEKNVELGLFKNLKFWEII